MLFLLTREICRLEDDGLHRQIYTLINKHTYTHTLAAHEAFQDLTYIMKQLCLSIY